MTKISQPEQINELEFIQKETLTRLEWDKVTLFLSHFATFAHTKELLKCLSPWDSQKPSIPYKELTKEALFLFEKGCKISLENFILESFEKSLMRGALLSPVALYHISTVLKLVQALQLFAKINNIKNGSTQHLSELFETLKPHQVVLQKLLKSVNDQGDILPTASLELAAAHRNHATAKRKITENLEHILKNSTIKNALQDSTWMLKEGRYVLPVRVDRKNDVVGIARGLSQTGATVFIEPAALSQEQAALEKALLEIQIEEHKVIKSLSEDCYLIADDILTSVEALTTLDDICARAQFASALEAHDCAFQQRSPVHFSFVNAKHPLFIFEKKPCIANTIELINSNILVLSGPNAGGKTVVLKTVGVFALMAKCGLFLPCEKAQSIEYENIFVLLGDRQSREEDLSTFSGHLEQIKKILHFANEKTLILLDEGFVGTDPAVGVALARAVLEYFAQKKATVIITTHFSSLKTLANDNPAFQNASMEFEAKNLRPTYKLLNGIPGQSYALELCERMGIDPYIISEARKYYGNDAQRMENILQKLQEQKIQINEEIETQKKLSLQLKEELEKIAADQKSLHEIKESLVEGYRTKLTKRFNAFSNRLDIRERQFQKKQESLLEDFKKEADLELMVPAVKPRDDKAQSDATQSMKKISLTSFDDLAKIKLENYSRSLKSTTNEIENFRQPKQMTHRSLIDEAQESLETLHKSFEQIEEDLNEELSVALKINKSAKQKAHNLASHIPTSQQNQKPVHFWKEGMRVKTEKFREAGYILKAADSKGQVECQFGPIKIKIFHSQLMTIAEAAQKSLPTQTKPSELPRKKITEKLKTKAFNSINPSISSVLPHPGNTLDLRGKTVDESLSRLDIFLDKMGRSEVSQVVIIHGHGFGKVKEAVRKYLENSSYQLSFRPGRHGEGGDGVTVVEFEN